MKKDTGFSHFLKYTVGKNDNMKKPSDINNAFYDDDNNDYSHLLPFCCYFQFDWNPS